MFFPRAMPISLIALLLALAPTGSRAQEKVDYLRAIKPILAEKCFSCHGALQQKSELRLDTVQAMRQGGSNGPAILAGDAEKSLLLDHVLGRNGVLRMPPASEAEP